MLNTLRQCRFPNSSAYRFTNIISHYNDSMDYEFEITRSIFSQRNCSKSFPAFFFFFALLLILSKELFLTHENGCNRHTLCF